MNPWLGIALVLAILVGLILLLHSLPPLFSIQSNPPDPQWNVVLPTCLLSFRNRACIANQLVLLVFSNSLSFRR